MRRRLLSQLTTHSRRKLCIDAADNITINATLPSATVGDTLPPPPPSAISADTPAAINDAVPAASTPQTSESQNTINHLTSQPCRVCSGAPSTSTDVCRCARKDVQNITSAPSSTWTSSDGDSVNTAPASIEITAPSQSPAQQIDETGACRCHNCGIQSHHAVCRRCSTLPKCAGCQRHLPIHLFSDKQGKCKACSSRKGRTHVRSALKNVTYEIDMDIQQTDYEFDTYLRRQEIQISDTLSQYQEPLGYV